MIDVCDAAGVRLMIHENWRYRPWYRALRAEIDAGTVGRPIRLRIAHRDTRALRPDGFADQPYLATNPRLILMEMGCHLVDTARYLIGEIQTVRATIGRFGKGHPGEDLASLDVYFAGGVLGWLDMSWCALAEVARAEWALNETVVEGTSGSLSLQTDGSLLFRSLSGKTERDLSPSLPTIRSTSMATSPPRPTSSTASSTATPTRPAARTPSRRWTSSGRRTARRRRGWRSRFEKGGGSRGGAERKGGSRFLSIRISSSATPREVREEAHPEERSRGEDGKVKDFFPADLLLRELRASA